MIDGGLYFVILIAQVNIIVAVVLTWLVFNCLELTTITSTTTTTATAFLLNKYTFLRFDKLN